MELYGSAEAARYLGIAVVTLKYHVAQGHLTPTKIGRSWVFDRAQLDEFQRTKRPAHRPPKESK